MVQVQTEFTVCTRGQSAVSEMGSHIHLQEWTAKAEQFCPRIANPREAEEVARLLDSAQRALKERERR